MSFAFPAFFIFLLSLPGILFRHGYFVGTWFGPTRFKTIIEELALGLSFALFLHLIWIYLTECLTSYTIEYQVIISLMLGAEPKQNPGVFHAIIGNSVVPFGYYIISLYLFSFLVGVNLQKPVRKMYIDRSFRPISIYSDWYYLMQGEERFDDVPLEDFHAEKTFLGIQERLKFLKYTKLSADPDRVFVAVVVENGDCAYLYYGLLVSWRLDSTGQIEKLVLSAAHRRRLADDTSMTAARDNTELPRSPMDTFDATVEREEFYRIEGDYLTIRGSDMKTLNLQYVWLKEVSAEASE